MPSNRRSPSPRKTGANAISNSSINPAVRYCISVCAPPPVGTAYSWYILADQIVTKLDANSYTTEMKGLKYKLAHKRAGHETWSASERAKRKRLVQILRETIAELERQPAPAPVRETVAAR